MILLLLVLALLTALLVATVRTVRLDGYGGNPPPPRWPIDPPGGPYGM